MRNEGQSVQAVFDSEHPAAAHTDDLAPSLRLPERRLRRLERYGSLILVVGLLTLGVAFRNSHLADSDGRNHADLDSYEARAHLFESRDEKARRATMPLLQSEALEIVAILKELSKSKDEGTRALAEAMLADIAKQASK